MKKIEILVCFSILGLSLSCSKESEKSVITSGGNIYVSNIPKSTGESSDKILVFSDAAAFDSTLAYLITAVQEHDDNFVAEYVHLNEDELNAMEATSGHYQYAPP